MTQQENVLTHLMKGKTLTPLEALGLYGIFRLSHWIYVLRNKGYKILMTRKRSINKKPYGEYRMDFEAMGMEVPA